MSDEASLAQKRLELLALYSKISKLLIYKMHLSYKS